MLHLMPTHLKEIALNTDDSNSIPTIITLAEVPEFAHGYVRDVQVRWALEEAGRPYHVRLIKRADQDTPAYRQLQLFGQVPVYQEGDLTLFESAAIVHHIGSTSAALMPQDAAGRSRALSWMFAAYSSLEPHVHAFNEVKKLDDSERRSSLKAKLEGRLSALDKELTGRDYLLEQFSAADILMTAILRYSNLVPQFPALLAYLQRCMARPAFQKALADHLASFAAPA